MSRDTLECYIATLFLSLLQVLPAHLPLADSLNLAVETPSPVCSSIDTLRSMMDQSLILPALLGVVSTHLQDFPLQRLCNSEVHFADSVMIIHQGSHIIYHYREPGILTVLLGSSVILGPLLAHLHHEPGLLLHTSQIILLGVKQVLVYYIAMALSITAYRCTPLHPIYHVPGPFICRLTQLWIIRSIMRGKTRMDIQKLHERYGDVVRIGKQQNGL